MEFRVRLVQVTHDGFCFYRAMEIALGEEGNGRGLFQRLAGYLHTANTNGNDLLNAHLSDVVVGSGINALAQQLDSTPPTLTDRDSWAGMPELVALVHMLGRPVLVWHINQHLQVDEHSLLVTPESIMPVFSIEESSGIAIPDIQLVQVENEWWLLDAKDSLQAWEIGWQQYRSQMAGVLQQQLIAVSDAHVKALPQYDSAKTMDASVISDATMMMDSHGMVSDPEFYTPSDFSEADGDTDFDGWVHYVGETVPDNRLLLLRSSLTALEEIIFSASWFSLMEEYIRMKFELSFAISEADTIVAPEFHWSPERYGRVTSQIDLISLALVSPISARFIEGSISGYLKAFNVRLVDFVWSLLPARHSVWDTLSKLKLVIDSLEGLNLAGYFSSFLASSQASDVTATVDEFDLSGFSDGPLFPERISVTPGKVEIPFDASNPLHHILFSLYMSAKAYQMANQS